MGSNSHPVQAICMGALFDNLALIQNNNLFCPLSDVKRWAMKIKVLSKAMRLSTIRFSVKISKLLVASSKIKTDLSVKRARRAILCRCPPEIPAPSKSILSDNSEAVNNILRISANSTARKDIFLSPPCSRRDLSKNQFR